MTQARRPVGVSDGGQFATQPKAEPELGLTPDRLTAEVAHRVEASQLLQLLPGASQRHLPDVRRELARTIQAGPGRGRRYTTWQDAWNELAEVDHRGHGLVRLASVACPGCNGRGFDTRHPGRNLARTGHPAICGQCSGRRRTSVSLPARRAIT